MKFTYVFALLTATAAAAFAQDGDVAAGAQLAADTCAECHDVSAEGAFKTYPPSFASIAAFRPDDQIMSRIWFPPMHANMPPMMYRLDSDNVQNLTAYIISLHPKK